MNCNEFKNLLDALVDAELDPADRAAATEHLGSCAACARLEYATLRVKENVHEKAYRPGLRNSSAGAALRSRLEERLRREAGAESRSPSVGTRPTRKIRYLSLSNLGVAAAILIVATLAFFFLPDWTTPKLGHYVAAEGVRDAFLRNFDGAGKGEVRPLDESELRKIVRDEIGIELEGIDVSESEFLGSYAENVAGRKAVRMDFRCRSKAGVAAGGETQIISVFLLPMNDIAFPQQYLDQLEKEGHYCQPCISYEGTIYCVRKDDLFVAAVSNLAKQELAAVVNVR